MSSPSRAPPSRTSGSDCRGSGLAGVPGSVETDDNGIARVELTAADAGELTLSARSEPLASTLPAYYFPTTPVGLRNGQRMLAPDSQRVTGESSVTVGKVRITASTVARPGTVLVGQPARDVVTLTGALPSYRGTSDAALYGPFRAASQIVCSGEPARRGTFRANGPGTYRTEAARLAETGRLRVPGGDPGRCGPRWADDALQRPVGTGAGRGAAACDDGRLLAAHRARARRSSTAFA